MSTNIKIAFFDVDGTLASNSKGDKGNIIDRIPESTKLALKLLKENNIVPVIATGRGKHFIQPLISELHMDSYISSNGLSVTYKNEEIFQSFLEPQQLIKIIDQLENIKDANVLLETNQGVIDINQNFNRESLNNLHNVYQIIVSGKNLRGRVSIDVPGIKANMVAPVALNILPEHISKASGIKKMLDILGFSTDEAIAFGDEENDLEMFKAVGNSVAMGNGVDELKKIATYVTSDVDEDGIYHACKYFKLI